MTKPSIELDLQIQLAAWRSVPNLKTRLKKAAKATQNYLPETLQFATRATILLAGNSKIRQLNHDFRGMDKPTNVLSFPQHEPKKVRTLASKKTKEPIDLGDIALAYQYVAAEARKDDKLLIDHVTHLIIHGLLHLFGYDHIREADAQRMEKAEIQILESLDLPNPYATPSRKGK